MKKLLIAIVLFGVLFSCSEEEKRLRPATIIGSDSMSLILSEVHIINAMHQHREIRKNKLQPYVLKEYTALFDSIGIKPERFEESLSWWTEDPDSLEYILDEALNLLNEKAEEFKASKKAIKSTTPVKPADEEKLKEMMQKQELSK